MTKFIKGALITGILCIVFGMGIFFAGKVMGGGRYVKNMDFSSMLTTDSKNLKEEYATLEKTKIDDFDKINIKTNTIDIKIAQSDDKNCYIAYNLKKEKGEVPAVYEVSGGEFKLRQKSNHVTINVDLSGLAAILSGTQDYVRQNQFVLYLPKDKQISTAEFDTEDGDISIDGLKSDKTDIAVDAGDIKLENAELQSGKITSSDGDIVVKNHEFNHLRDKHKFWGLPVIRGMVNFVESMILGYRMLMYSAEASGMEDLEDVEMNKFEKWLTDKLGDKFMNILMGIATVLGFALAFVIFFYLPVLAFNKLNQAFDGSLTPWQGTIEGVMKILIFVIYIAIVSQMKDIKRTFMYHGAEHKSIACYEAGKELTVENVRESCRFHPRCGTSFIFVMLIFSIIFSTVLSKIFPSIAQVRVLWMLLKLAFIPLLMGVGYEFIKYAGKHDNLLVKILSAPGLWMQRLTTKEPTDDIIEVGIESLKAVITDNPEDDEIK